MKKIFLIFCCLCHLFAMLAQIRGNEIRVQVSPDHADWKYNLNETCTFTIQVFKAQNPLSEVTIDYELGPEMYPVESKKGVMLKNGKLTLRGSLKTPGFLRCKVKAYVGGRTYDGLANVGFAPDKLSPIAECPADFRDFWANELALARTMPLNPQMTLLPELCTATDNVYHVNFRINQGESRFYGILSVPKKEGRYPALLRVPGAGIRPYTGDTYTAPGKVITLEVGVHGIPVTMERSFYNNLMDGALKEYWTFCSEDTRRFYYHRVILGSLRAVDFICQLPQFDGTTLGVTGSSQGGALSMIAASLDSRVTFFAALHPALCDHEAFLQKRAGGWPHYLYNKNTGDKPDVGTLRYYDVANFARYISVPGWFSWGYNDEVCPPTSLYSAYNQVEAPKELRLYLESGHYWYQEQWEEWQGWLKKQLLNTPATTQNTFIRINDNGQFIRKEKPYYFIGTNFWYGAILGSEGLGGDRRRLCRELDLMKETGITNLRVLVGANGTDGVKTRVEPALQTAPGVYNDTLLDGLDFFMNELHKRDMTAVLYLNNSWEWSGGYSVYLEWAGYGKAVVPAIDGWPAYMKYVSQFQQSEAAKTLFANYVRDIIGRTNRYNQLKYTDDPTILSWQIGNEPRAFSNENKESFATWMAETASLIKSLDSNHLVSSGSEGEWGCENDMALFEQIHANKHIDYLNIHIWPYNWGWVKADSLAEYLPAAIENTHHYIDKHLIVARKYKKPIVIEEFGFPRDGFRFEKQAPVVVRDRYYKAVFDRIVTDKKQSGLIAGCNFWAWGGFAKQNPNCVFWSRGDDYMGDPAQEEQGLNSVFAEDTTIRLIKESNYKLSSCESVDN